MELNTHVPSDIESGGKASAFKRSLKECVSSNSSQEMGPKHQKHKGLREVSSSEANSSRSTADSHAGTPAVKVDKRNSAIFKVPLSITSGLKTFKIPSEEDITIHRVSSAPNVNEVFQSIHEDLSDTFLHCVDRDISHTYVPTKFLKRSKFSAAARTLVVDWIMEIEDNYSLRRDSLHMSIQLMDRALSRKQFDNSNFQLLGITVIFITTKFLYRNPFDVWKLCYLTDHTYTTKNVCDMERTVLSIVEYAVTLPVATDYDEFVNVINADIDNEPFRLYFEYLTDLCLVDDWMSSKSIILRTISCVFVTRSLLAKDSQSHLQFMIKLTTYNVREAMYVAIRLLHLIKSAALEQYPSLTRKYTRNESNKKYIATLFAKNLEPFLVAFKKSLNLPLRKD